MGFRFRKSKKIGPFRVTASKSGLSVSAGVKGARVRVNSSGRVTKTVGIPGTGLSWSSSSSGGKAPPVRETVDTGPVSSSNVLGCLAAVFVFPFLGCLMCGLFGALLPDAEPMRREVARRPQRLVSVPPTVEDDPTPPAVDDSSASDSLPRIDIEPERPATPSPSPDPNPKPPSPKRDLPPARLWHDSSGQHQTWASLVGIEGEKILLVRKNDGREVSLPLPRLSAGDREYALAEQINCERFTGKVVRIVDGDTVEVLVNQKPVKVRLEGIDAPETGQAFATEAKKAAASLCFGKAVVIHSTGRDRYGRLLGFVHVDDKTVNEELLAAGMAWHTGEDRYVASLDALESQARAAGVGLWSISRRVAPWDWRISLPVDFPGVFWACLVPCCRAPAASPSPPCRTVPSPVRRPSPFATGSDAGDGG